jgi:hypothetical protein
LIRVMMPILPLVALIAVRGIDILAIPADRALRSPAFHGLCAAAILIFPFTGSEYAFRAQRDFGLKADQVAENRISEYIKTTVPDYKRYEFYYEPCHLSVSLGLNYFDSTQHKRFLNAFEENSFKSKSFLIWDDWFAPVEGHVDSTRIDQDTRFELLRREEETNYWGQKRVVKLYRKRE